MLPTNISNRVFSIQNEFEFAQLAITVFRYQYQNNWIYRRYCNLLGIQISEVATIEDIPYLPIEFFKSHKVTCHENSQHTLFRSSGTSGFTSSHYVADIDLYIASFTKTFSLFYGDIENLTILALLPSYLERGNSSLVYMVNYLIKKTHAKESGFFLEHSEKLISILEKNKRAKARTLLIGVSFALLDFISVNPIALGPHTTVMETGGMKANRKEIVRRELHEKLQLGFGVQNIHSEYGMTELLSQAYALQDGVFRTPPWMKVCMRDTKDPLRLVGTNKRGGINVIDLANLHSCAFIATQDLGIVHEDESFSVLGRLDQSESRGCNLMIENLRI